MWWALAYDLILVHIDRSMDCYGSYIWAHHIPLLTMKSLLTLLGLLISAHFVNAQDTLYRMNGESIGVKVLEVSPKEVKYVLSSNPSGPTYIVLKSEVYMIEYANGTKDVFGSKTIVPENDVAAKDTSVLRYEKEYKKLRGGGVACTVLGSIGLAISVPILVYGLVDLKDGGFQRPLVAGAFTIISAGLLGGGISQLNKAAEIRMRLARHTTASLTLSPDLLNTTAYDGPLLKTGSGIGIRAVIQF